MSGSGLMNRVRNTVRLRNVSSAPASGQVWRQGQAQEGLGNDNETSDTRLGHARSWLDALDPLESAIVRFHGLALKHVLQIQKQLVDKVVAKDVELYVVRRAANEDGLRPGTTVRMVGVDGAVVEVRDPWDPDRIFRLEKRDVELKARKDWSMEDVCRHFVLPVTMESKRAYVEHQFEVDPPSVSREPFEGAFVTVPRSSSFADVCESLESYFAGYKLDKTFVWLDVFCGNQHLLMNHNPVDHIRGLKRTLIEMNLHHAIGKFQQRILYFNSWLDPTPLSRSWCLWEMYGAILTGKPLGLIFQPGEEERFLETLLTDYTQISNVLTEVDTRRGRCLDSFDEQLIRETVNRCVSEGFATLNTVILSQLRKSLTQTTRDIVDTRRSVIARLSTRNRKNDKQILDYATLLLHAGRLMMGFQGQHKLGLLRYCQEALNIRKGWAGNSSPEVAEVLADGFGVYYLEKAKYEQALEVYEQALEMLELNFGPDHERVGDVLHQIGWVHHCSGKHGEALASYIKALKIRKEALGETHTKVADTLNNIAIVHKSQNNLDLALEAYNEALTIKTKAFGEENATVASIVNNMGNIYTLKGKTNPKSCKQALELYEKALKIRKSCCGEKHPLVGTTLSNMAGCYRTLEKYDHAIELYEQDLTILKETIGCSHPDVASILSHIALTYYKQQKFSMALKTYQHALEIRSEALGSYHPLVASSLYNIANCLDQLNRTQEALDKSHSAYRIWSAELGEEHRDTKDAKLQMKILEMKLSKLNLTFDPHNRENSLQTIFSEEDDDDEDEEGQQQQHQRKQSV